MCTTGGNGKLISHHLVEASFWLPVSTKQMASFDEHCAVALSTPGTWLSTEQLQLNKRHLRQYQNRCRKKGPTKKRFFSLLPHGSNGSPMTSLQTDSSSVARWASNQLSQPHRHQSNFAKLKPETGWPEGFPERRFEWTPQNANLSSHRTAVK